MQQWAFWADSWDQDEDLPLKHVCDVASSEEFVHCLATLPFEVLTPGSSLHLFRGTSSCLLDGGHFKLVAKSVRRSIQNWEILATALFNGHFSQPQMCGLTLCSRLGGHHNFLRIWMSTTDNVVERQVRTSIFSLISPKDFFPMIPFELHVDALAKAAIPTRRGGLRRRSQRRPNSDTASTTTSFNELPALRSSRSVSDLDKLCASSPQELKPSISPVCLLCSQPLRP